MHKAKKSLGQHFLVQPGIAEKIARGLTLKGYEQVLEVGPGRGILTRFLQELPVKITAVELDDNLFEELKMREDFSKVQFIHGNFLKLDLDAVMPPGSFALVGNFPYMISSQIVFKMLESKDRIPELVGMFQKEMAQRIIAAPGSKNYGVISVLNQLYYYGEMLFYVNRKNFSPPPKVESAVIRLKRRDDIKIDCDDNLLRQIVKLAFGQRRKMLRNSLKSLFSSNTLSENAHFTLRPERLTPEAFVDLTRLLEQERKENR